MSLPLSNLFGQWQPDGVPVCDTSANVWPTSLTTIPQIAPDGEGGAYVCWVDVRNGNLDIFAQRIDSSGAIVWERNGIPIVTAPESQGNMHIVNDGFGNALIAWGDDRSVTNTEMYVQKVGRDGQVLWQTDGVKAAEISGLDVRIAPDETGGALVAWITGGVFDIVVQRLDISGNRVWGDSGVQVTNRPETVEAGDVWIVSDRRKGAIVAWAEGDRVYSQRVDSSGVTRWLSNGVLLSDTINSNISVACVPDGRGGAIVRWIENVQEGDAFAQRVDSTGVPQWGSGGLLLGSAGGGGNRRITSDGFGGAFVGHGLFIQHVDSSGVKLWQPDGVPYTTLSSIQSTQAMSPNGGIWNFCQSLVPNEGFYLYGQWIDGDGTPRWGTDGTRLLSTNSTQQVPQAADDGFGHCFVTWEDYRNGYWTVFVAKVDTNGLVTSVDQGRGDTHPRTPKLYQNYPNPFNPETTISYEIPRKSFVVLKIFDTLGRELREMVSEEQQPGSYSIKLSLENVSSGVYFYRLITGENLITKRMLLIR